MPTRVTTLKIACTLLSGLMLLFAGVQCNDPDGLAWVAVYAIPATFMALGAVRPARLRRFPARLSLGVALAFLAVLGTFLWPDQPGFWRAEVWWEQETAREGMGAAIAFAVTAFAVPLALPFRRARPARGVRDVPASRAPGADAGPTSA